MDAISYTDLRQGLAAAMDRVNEDHAPPYITRQGGKAAVLLSAEDYSTIEETMHLLSSARNSERLNEAIEDLRKGCAEERDLIE